MSNEIEINGEVYIKKGSEVSVPCGEYGVWEIGEEYHIETVTKYFSGVLVAMDETDFVLSKCSWIESTGNFSDYVKGADPSYCEPYAEDQLVNVSRGAYVSAVKRAITSKLIGR